MEKLWFENIETDRRRNVEFGISRHFETEIAHNWRYSQNYPLMVVIKYY